MALLACSAPVRPALAIDDLLSEPTPLILKDGRIAQVSVHTIPFATGSGELDAEAAADLDALLEPFATDCFLTAQAIGHVEPGLNRDGDTLNAHRLARARADFVQAALAGHGMQLAAVASVWDWQFLVKDSRVTLWVFRLNVGDDCEGTPLPGDLPVAATARAPVVAAASPPPAEAPAPVKAPAKTPPAAEAPATAAAAGKATAAPRELSVAEAPPATTPAADPAPAPTPTPVQASEPPAPVVEPQAVVAESKQPAPVEPPAPAEVAAAPEPVVAAAPPPAEPAPAPASTPVSAPEPTPATGDELPGPAIVFAVNSSFFSGSASRDLKAFVEQLPRDAEVEIELAAAVGTGDVRDADPAEAKRYNAWMAERRLQRVAEWLTSNAGPRQLKLQEQFIENDPSREVRLQARVLP